MIEYALSMVRTTGRHRADVQREVFSMDDALRMVRSKAAMGKANRQGKRGNG